MKTEPQPDQRHDHQTGAKTDTVSSRSETQVSETVADESITPEQLEPPVPPLPPAPHGSPCSSPSDDPNAKTVTITDIFSNLEALAMPTSYADAVPVRKIVTKVTLTKRPTKGRFFRLKPDFCTERPLPLLTVDRESYLIATSELIAALSSEDVFRWAHLFGGILRPDNSPFVWWITVGTNDRRSDWWESAMEAANAAQRRWVRLVTAQDHFDYEEAVATDDQWPPKWPNLTWLEMLRLAFKGLVIEDENHPALVELRGGR